MTKYMGLSSCGACGYPIYAQLTGRIQKCDKHPDKNCWLWEYVPNVICPNCGAIQVALHQPDGTAFDATQKMYDKEIESPSFQPASQASRGTTHITADWPNDAQLI